MGFMLLLTLLNFYSLSLRSSSSSHSCFVLDPATAAAFLAAHNTADADTKLPVTRSSSLPPPPSLPPPLPGGPKLTEHAPVLQA